MNPSITLLNLAGNVTLLLWGLYMVQTGIMNAFGTDIRRILGKALRNRLKGFFAGLFATTLLQSSTAVGLMATSFAASKMVGLIPALAVMLGANVGTTIIVQALSFDHSALAPIVVLIGFVTFKRSSRTNIRDFCRAIIGLGLMLFALQHMMTLLAPAEESQSIKLILDTISRDHLLDMVFAAALTWVMHSSVAVVLVAMSFASQGLIPLDVAFALVLGANLGSAINPLVETAANGNPATHRLPFGNFINRAVGCLIFLPLLAYISDLPEAYTANASRAVASFHTVFNLTMALLFFPLLTPLARILQNMLPEKTSAIDLAAPIYLDEQAMDRPALAVINAARETMRMADMAEKMLVGVMDLLANNDRKRIHELSQMDDVMDKLNQQIKNYVTSLDNAALAENDIKRTREVMTFAMNLEHIGDIISGGLSKSGAKKIERKVVFSSEGWAEIAAMLSRVTGNVRLASAVFMTRELRAAKQLMAEKIILRDMETSATETHFQRLREKRSESVETSTLHLDIIRDLKRINSHLTATAFFVLEENNQLLPSRLRDE